MIPLYAISLVSAVVVAAQPAQRPDAVRQFVSVDAPVVALTHARVIDGTGSPARADQTLLIKDGKIAAVGEAGQVSIPEGATTIDLTGKSVIPGLVMVHEHLYYPTGPNVYGQLGASFVRLYLAGGVTTMRTGGNTNGVMDINLKRQIESGTLAGPAIDATGPYLNGPQNQLQMHALKDADDARRHVAYLEVLLPELREQFEQAHQRIVSNPQSVYGTLFPKGMALERAFARAGGLLIAGTIRQEWVV